jgi:antitoxin component of MazEF toxin-antitoxin module
VTIITTVRMWGDTPAIRIPRSIARESGLEPGARVSVTRSAQGLVVRPLRQRKTYRFSELLAQCKGPNPHREAITGRAGRESF